MRFPGYPAAPKDQRNDSMRKVLVDACEAVDRYGHARLLEDFSLYTLFESFAEFQHATGSLPMAGVIAPDDQNSVLVVHYDTGDTD